MPVHVHATLRNIAQRHVRQKQLGAAGHVHGAVDLIETLQMSGDRAVELVIAEHQHLPSRRHPEALQPTA